MVVFRADGCGITCLMLTYASIFYADYVVVKVLIVPVLDGSLTGSFIVIFFNLLVTLMVVAHLRAVLSDPGMVPVANLPVDLSDQDFNEKKGPNEWTLCVKCETYRPPRAHHCRVCRRCIRRMDHHCPWINNCVGEWNQKYFIQFLVYVGLTSLACVSLIITSWVLDPASPHLKSQELKVIHSILLSVISILYGLFVIAIMSDQFGAICNDETPIESLQKGKIGSPDFGIRPQKKSTMALLRLVFGRGPVITWLWPCDFGSSPRTLEPQHSYHV